MSRCPSKPPMARRPVAHEIRYIAFDRREVADMVRDFAAARMGSTPEGRVVEVEKLDDKIIVTFEDENERQTALRLTHQDSIACMLAYCMKRRYPVAQKSSKDVEVTGNALILAMRGKARPLNVTAEHHR